MTEFKQDDIIICNNIEPLSGNEVAPPLTLGTEYPVKGIVLDEKGNQHLDVGLKSNYNWVRSYETGELLPDGDVIHWCHPSRFTLK